MKYKAVFFDFDGVLSHDYFYENLRGEIDEVYDFIQREVFGGGVDLVHRWMKGVISYKDVNGFISRKTGIDIDRLNKLLLESVKQMVVDKRLLSWAIGLKDREINIALVTDNMDVFNEVTIGNHRLDEVFPLIVNSSDYGILKTSDGKDLFDVALERIGELNSFEKVLMIDNSSKVKAAFERKGGECFLFTDYENFEPWAKKNLLLN